jgi:hypothetical protein
VVVVVAVKEEEEEEEDASLPSHCPDHSLVHRSLGWGVWP